MEMSVGALDHYNVSTCKLKETVQFYEDVLGFVNGPQFSFPGAWLYSAGPCRVAPQRHFPDGPAPTPGFRRHRLSHRVCQPWL